MSASAPCSSARAAAAGAARASAAAGGGGGATRRGGGVCRLTRGGPLGCAGGGARAEPPLSPTAGGAGATPRAAASAPRAAYSAENALCSCAMTVQLCPARRGRRRRRRRGAHVRSRTARVTRMEGGGVLRRAHSHQVRRPRRARGRAGTRAPRRHAHAGGALACARRQTASQAALAMVPSRHKHARGSIMKHSSQSVWPHGSVTGR